MSNTHNSYAWKKLRDEKLKSLPAKYLPGCCTSSWWCELCGKIGDDVHVHYKSYSTSGNRLIVPLDELIVICSSCHASMHSANDDGESLCTA